MANQNASIRYVLERLCGEIRQQALKQSFAAKGKKVGDPREREFWGKLALYEQDLRRILRLLLGKQIALANERQLLWRIPRDQRFSARQSVADREQVNLDLVELAEMTLRELLSMSGDASAMKPGDWEEIGQTAMEFADKLDHALIHTVVQQIQKGPAFTGTPLPGLGLEHLAPLIGLLIACIMRKRPRHE
jgi:hypothetical protein